MKKNKTPEKNQKNDRGFSVFKEVLVPTFSLCLILCVTVALLALTRHFTEKNAKPKLWRYEDSVYTQIYDDLGKMTEVAYTGEQENVLEVLSAGEGRYLISVSAKGYASTPIEVVVGIQSSYVADGICVAVCEETQGLGANITKDKFLETVIGEEGPFVLGENLDGIAAATYSTKAFTKAVNTAFEVFEEIKEGDAQ